MERVYSQGSITSHSPVPERPRKPPPPRPPPPNTTPLMQQLSKTTTSSKQQSNALSPTRPPPPIARSAKITNIPCSPTKQRRPVPVPRRLHQNTASRTVAAPCNEGCVVGGYMRQATTAVAPSPTNKLPKASPRRSVPRKGNSTENFQSQNFTHQLSLPTEFHNQHSLPRRPKPPPPVLEPSSSYTADYADHIYEKVKQGKRPPPVPPRPAVLLSRRRSSSPPPVHRSLLVSDAVNGDSEDKEGYNQLYTPLLARSDTVDSDYVVLQKTSAITAIPNNKLDELPHEQYMAISNETIELGNIYQSPNIINTDQKMYQVPKPTSSISPRHYIYPETEDSYI